ncbi:hypothetical protein A2229_01040 [Candidatus Peregrinibacteria bacterium RIFOXYA2_FULL_33_7]|nr:MAG: hypothetical protein A2229_01040 [Candidatus Peregrinibacteria bacterium RIFOXYA2_FULL_33_7]
MTFTSLPSIKGQVTIPTSIRKKYKISKETPIKIEDQGNGQILLKVMKIMDFNEIQLSESKNEVSLTFKKGIDPQVLIDKIKEIDG